VKKRAAIRLTAMAAVLSASAVVPLAATAPASAYCPGEGRWDKNRLKVAIGGAVPEAWVDSIKYSLDQWSGVSDADWHLNLTTGSDQDVTIRFSKPPNGWDAPTPGQTEYKWGTPGAGKIVGADIYLNPEYSWNEGGDLNKANKIADVRTIVVHELGHLLRLKHPNQCGPGDPMPVEERAAMTVSWEKRWTINADDKSGLRYKYPAP
jgi:hypothetical protein